MARAKNKKLVNYDLTALDHLVPAIAVTLRELFPLNRSLTGAGVRQTYRILRRIGRFKVQAVPSGKKVFDWTVPPEWMVRAAYIKDAQGKIIIDFKKNNLHLMGYSQPVNRWMSYRQLIKHLHALPTLPGAIPYRTTYYKKDWGFCLSQRQLQHLDRRGRYQVVIDSQLKPGHLLLGDYVQPGPSRQEYLLSTYSCHPSLANDNLSGLVLWAYLLKIVQSTRTRHSYRFTVWPETIGALAYLATHPGLAERLTGGLVIATVGGPGRLGYKQTWQGDSVIDQAVAAACQRLKIKPLLYPFSPSGSDERQLSSPGFRVPVGSITKDKYLEYRYYHTSLDDLNFVKAEYIVKALKLYLATLQELEKETLLHSNFPFGEPHLGKRGLYPTMGGASYGRRDLDTIRWILFYADGRHTMAAIAKKAKLPYSRIRFLAKKLQAKGVISAS